MLGLVNKEYSTNIESLVSNLRSKKKQVVGVKLENSYTENLNVESVVMNGTVSNGYFVFELDLKPLPSQLPMIKKLNSNLIDSGLGLIDIDKETRELHEQEKYNVLLANFYENEQDIRYKATFSFDVGQGIEKTNTRIGGKELTIYKLTHKYLDTETNVYVAVIDKDYDGQTMLGTFSVNHTYMKKQDTLKLLNLLSGSPLFGLDIISIEYSTNESINYLFDSTQLGMGLVIPYISELKNHKFFYLYSGETELYIRFNDIKGSYVERVNYLKNGFRLVMNLTNNRTLTLNFG